MSDDDAFDQRLLKPSAAYAKLYPSITTRLKSAYDAGHPTVRAVAQAMCLAIQRAGGAREQLLRETHRLSPQETRICLHLIDGGSVASCAAVLGVAESTIRTHLKSIFAKTGAHRQADLHKLLPSR